MSDPLWKIALNWGTVIAFFVVPIGFFTLQMLGAFEGKESDCYAYLREFQRNLTILVFGLAGLRTWEQLKGKK